MAALIVTVCGVVVTGVAVAVEPTMTAPGEASTPARRIDPPRHVLVVGDSAIAAIRWVPGAASAVLSRDFVALDLESCRRLVAESCRGREGRRPPTVLDVVGSLGNSYATLVVATGYNDVASTFSSSFSAIVAEARRTGIRRIVWFTLREDERSGERVEGHRAHNERLEFLASLSWYDDVEVADWADYTADRPEWFRSDGIHYSTLGAWGGADYLSRKLAHLDRRPCPMPVVPGGVRPFPCPDPDVTGPPTGLEELYPIGQDGVLCYVYGSDGQSRCATQDDSP